MRAKEFISEEISKGDEADFNKFVENCSEYFTYNKNPHIELWRGEHQAKGVNFLLPITRKVIEGRRPVDTPEVIHYAFNDEFVSYHNYPFRSGVMCSGSMSQAADYGKPCIIVPCNGFTLCYSPVYHDMYANAVTDRMKELEQMLGSEEADFHIERDLQKEIHKSFIKGKYQSGPDKIDAAIKSNHEVMLYPTDGIELNYYLFTEQFWLDNILDRVERIFK